MDRQEGCVGYRSGLEHDFRRLEERRLVLQGELERAQEAHTAAKAALTAAEAALARASALYAGVEQDCVELRRFLKVTPDAVNGLPAELLDAIFVTLANEPDPLWLNIEGAEYNDARAMLPYRLSAVCRHWRSVALSSSHLWTYVALPPLSAVSVMRRRSILLDHVALRLERSRCSGIDVCIDFIKYLEPGALSFWMEALTLVIDNAWRWRCVKFRVPFPNSTFEQLMSRRSLPLLEELGMHCHGDSGVMDVSWVCHAPSLRALSSPDIQFHLAAGTSTITSASLWVLSGSFNALGRMPLLESLSLDLTGVSDLRIAPTGTLTLPALKSLRLRGGRNVFERVLFLSFTGPQVTRLNISGDDLAVTLEAPVRDFALAFPNIVDLELDGETQHHHNSSPDMRPFSRVKTIALIGWSIPRWFFSYMDFADAAEPSRVRVCPELESLTIRYRPGEIYEPVLPDLAFFIRDRAAVCRARQKQFTVAFEAWPSDARLPSWFRQALAVTLGPSNLRITTADGLCHAAVEDSDEESEDEAQFTDFETSDSSASETDNSDDESNGPELAAGSGAMWVNGPLWETDSEDTDYEHSEE